MFSGFFFYLSGLLKKFEDYDIINISTIKFKLRDYQCLLLKLRKSRSKDYLR